MELTRFVIIVVIGMSLCEIAQCDDVVGAFTAHEVVPDAVDVAPQEAVKVIYPSGVTVELGNELTPTQTKDVPIVEWNADPNQFYTLLMVDPDAPSRAEAMFRSVKHWAVINIPGSAVARGEEISGYLGAGPPDGSGLHRYVFLVYKQSGGKISYDGPVVSNKSLQYRPGWSAVNFAEEYNLGKPVAGNFFQAKYDDYVPILHAEIRLK